MENAIKINANPQQTNWNSYLANVWWETIVTSKPYQTFVQL